MKRPEPKWLGLSLRCRGRRLERKRERYAVSPVAVAIAIVVSAVVAICVGYDVEFHTHLVPLVLQIAVACAIHLVIDLACQIKNSACFVLAASQVASAAILVQQVVGRTLEAVCQVFYAANVSAPIAVAAISAVVSPTAVAVAPTIVVTVIDSVGHAFEVAGLLFEALKRSTDVAVVTAITITAVSVSAIAAVLC